MSDFVSSFVKRITHAFSHLPERWEHASDGGKLVMSTVSAAGVGVVIHGLVNVKRGLLGYRHEDGTEEKPAIGTLIFGLAEIGAAGAGLYALVTNTHEHTHGSGSCRGHSH